MNDEEASIQRAHSEGAQSFRAMRRNRTFPMPENPYHSDLYRWAWDLGWRSEEFLYA